MTVIQIILLATLVVYIFKTGKTTPPIVEIDKTIGHNALWNINGVLYSYNTKSLKEQIYKILAEQNAPINWRVTCSPNTVKVWYNKHVIFALTTIDGSIIGMGYSAEDDMENYNTLLDIIEQYGEVVG